MLLVGMPGATSSVLARSRDALPSSKNATSGDAAMPGAPSSVLAPSRNAFCS